MMCADMVDVRWRDKSGRSRKAVALLEDISLSGACLQFDSPIPEKTAVRIGYPRGALQGVVRYCTYREIGYFVGIEFSPDNRWSEAQFRPQHLLDMRRVLEGSFKTMPRRTEPTDKEDEPGYQ